MNCNARTSIIELSNLLAQNYQTIEDNGFPNGKLGVAISLYASSKLTDINLYEKVADDIIDICQSDIGGLHKSLSFDGLAGYGWGIEHLVQEKFVSGDTDEILKEIDKQIFTYLTYGKINDFSFYTGLGSIGFYLLKRICAEQANDENLVTLTCKTFIIRLTEEFRIHIQSLKKPIISSLRKTIGYEYIYLLILFVLLLKSKICFERVKNILDTILLDLNAQYDELNSIEKHIIYLYLTVLSSYGYSYKFMTDINEIYNNLEKVDIINEIKKIPPAELNNIIFTYNTLFLINCTDILKLEKEYWQDILSRLIKIEIENFKKNSNINLLNCYSGINYLLILFQNL